MIHTINQIRDYTLHATDGELGKVGDVYFDDNKWAVRYLIVDSGDWLVGRRVLISPHAIQAGPWEDNSIQVALTREQVQNSPDIFSVTPISREQEAEYFNYYGLPYYWTGMGPWGEGVAPAPGAIVTPMPNPVPVTPGPDEAVAAAGDDDNDNHLRSALEILGYSIHARDGEVGYVEDFTFDDETWTVQHLVVDTTSWLPGGEVIVAPTFVTRIDWAGREVYVDLDRKTIKNSKEFDRKAVEGKGEA